MRGVHLFTGRIKDDITSDLCREAFITFKIAGILVQIFVRTKLGRIDKYAGNEAVCPPSSLLHQFEVPLVKVPHGGNKSDFLALEPQRLRIFLHFQCR